MTLGYGEDKYIAQYCYPVGNDKGSSSGDQIWA